MSLGKEADVITSDELPDLLERLRFAATDDQSVEVKACAHGLPQSIAETVSAFANGSGGLMLLGLSEDHGFAPTPGFRAKPIAESLIQCCAERLTPPVRPDVAILEYRGAPVVAAVVDEISPIEKPCYVTARGRYHGSYIRVGDGDRRLSIYEIDRLLEERRQPTHDTAIVEDASPEELLDTIIDGILARQRALHPRIFGTLPRDEALVSLGILTKGPDGRLHPTLAGLLVAGNYPQRFFPRLTVTFAYYPGVRKTSGDAVKYLDSRSLAGPIPEILEEALALVSRNMRMGGVLDERGFRKDVPEYPIEAVREALCNAIMHRDYSPMGQGAQIQLNMYRDRLEILSPGGLYGPVTVESLGEPGISATRNRTLAALMETIPFRDGFIAENRGTGYQLITSLLKSGGNGRPEVRDTLSAFTIAFRAAYTGRIAGSDADACASPSDTRLSERLPYGTPQTTVDIPTHGTASPELTELERRMIGLIADSGTARLPQLVEATGQPRSTVTYQINKLIAAGIIERTQPARSPRQTYRLRRRA